MFFTKENFTAVLHYLPAFVDGVRLTVLLWATTAAVGLGLGCVLGVIRAARIPLVGWCIAVFVEFFRNTPVLIQLMWFFYAFPILIGQQMNSVEAATLGLCLNTAAYCSEIFRGGIQSIASGQWEAGRALGMSHILLMRRIVLPQAVRRMVPAFTNRLIELFKSTSVASVLAVHELMYQGRLVSGVLFLPMETFTVIGAMYFIVIYPATMAARALERRVRVIT